MFVAGLGLVSLFLNTCVSLTLTMLYRLGMIPSEQCATCLTICQQFSLQTESEKA